MKTDEFIPITPDSVLEVLLERCGGEPEPCDCERRRQPRWPFPGTVELWVPGAGGEESYLLARALNLSTTGIGILSDDDELNIGTELSIAIHQPEATLFGRAVVRHRTQRPEGQLVGLQFCY